MFGRVPGRVPGTRPNISESHSEISTRVPFCIVLAGVSRQQQGRVQNKVDKLDKNRLRVRRRARISVGGVGGFRGPRRLGNLRASANASCHTTHAQVKDKSDRATVEQVMDPRTRAILFKLLQNECVTSTHPPHRPKPLGRAHC